MKGFTPTAESHGFNPAVSMSCSIGITDNDRFDFSSQQPGLEFCRSLRQNLSKFRDIRKKVNNST